jgi:hypothetical protein
MDRFVILNKQKEKDEIIGRDEYIARIRNLLRVNKSFCLYGPTGVGKTFLVKYALQGLNYLELTSDFVKSVDRIKTMKVHVVADDVEVYESVSLGSTILISDTVTENFECMKIEPLSLKDMVEIGSKKFPGLELEILEQCSRDAKGDIRSFLFRLENFIDAKDIFKSPKNFVYDLVCRGGCLDPRDYIGKYVNEHGYSWGIIHENYPDSSSSMTTIDNISDLMSLADIKDEEMYKGYSQNGGIIFSLFGIILPAIEIGHSLEKETMRPGSAWTKYNNYKMRYRRYQLLCNKSSLDIDALATVSQYCKSKPVVEVIPILKRYGFESADIDMMNHISLINKIKPRVLQIIKTKLKSLCKQ